LVIRGVIAIAVGGDDSIVATSKDPLRSVLTYFQQIPELLVRGPPGVGTLHLASREFFGFRRINDASKPA
jgi:DNA polymerase III delta prime subunit